MSLKETASRFTENAINLPQKVWGIR